MKGASKGEKTEALRGNVLTSWHDSRTAASHAAFLLPYVHAGQSLLDGGCGTGSITLGLAETLAPGQVTGIDLDVDRIQRAQAAAEQHGVRNVRFEVGSVLELPYSDERFELVFANAVLEHLRNPAKALAEMYRVLRSGGLCAVSDTEHDGLIMHQGVDDPDFRQWEDFTKATLRSNGTNFYIGKQLKKLLRETGFVDLRVAASCEVFSTPDELATLGRLWGPKYLDRVGTEAPSAEVRRWRRAVDKWTRNPDSLVVLMRCQVVGRKPE
jgi:ubiquinone/menaquinone biosynthesis C-methylase UbiE